MEFTRAARQHFLCVGAIFLLAGISGDCHADAADQSGNAILPVSAPVVPVKPVPNHPSLTLDDGRLLAAGGMAINIGRSDHEMEDDSELWDPQTGRWQQLGSELKFDSGLRVSLNKLADGRILFFATREDGDEPEYRALIWNPQTGVAERLPVSAKPRLESDIAVMGDGRVLIINGNEGAADIWDSRTNRVVQSEVAQIENSRWKALPLKSGKVLLLESYPDNAMSLRKGIKPSVTLQWTPSSDEWLQLNDLPLPFRSSSILVQLDNGAVHAEVAGEAFELEASALSWNKVSPLYQPVSAAQPEMPVVQREMPASTVVPAANQLAGTSASPTTEPSWLSSLGRVFEKSKGIALAIAIPVLLYAMLLAKQRDGLESLRAYSGCMTRAAAIVLAALVIWAMVEVYGSYSDERLAEYANTCALEQRGAAGSQADTLNKAKQWLQCIEQRKQFYEGVALSWTKDLIMSLPSVPCQYVGVWHSRRPGMLYKVTLTDDSRFVAEQVQSNVNAPKTINGIWGVVDDKMVWLYDSDLVWPVDINRIQPDGRNHFVLNEVNGEHTDYQLVDAIKSNSCAD